MIAQKDTADVSGIRRKQIRHKWQLPRPLGDPINERGSCWKEALVSRVLTWEVQLIGRIEPEAAARWQQRLSHWRDRPRRRRLHGSVPSDRSLVAVPAGGVVVDPGRRRRLRRRRRRRPARLPEGHAAEVPELPAAGIASGGRVPLLAGDRHWGSYQCTAPGTDGEAPLWSWQPALTLSPLL